MSVTSPLSSPPPQHPEAQGAGTSQIGWLSVLRPLLERVTHGGCACSTTGPGSATGIGHVAWKHLAQWGEAYAPSPPLPSDLHELPALCWPHHRVMAAWRRVRK
jgi:hypothetical protein